MNGDRVGSSGKGGEMVWGWKAAGCPSPPALPAGSCPAAGVGHNPEGREGGDADGDPHGAGVHAGLDALRRGGVLDLHQQGSGLHRHAHVSACLLLQEFLPLQPHHLRPHEQTGEMPHVMQGEPLPLAYQHVWGHCKHLALSQKWVNLSLVGAASSGTVGGSWSRNTSLLAPNTIVFHFSPPFSSVIA